MFQNRIRIPGSGTGSGSTSKRSGSETMKNIVQWNCSFVRPLGPEPNGPQCPQGLLVLITFKRFQITYFYTRYLNIKQNILEDEINLKKCIKCKCIKCKCIIYICVLYSFVSSKELEVFGGHLLSEDDHSHWAPPYWNIMKELLGVELNFKSNCKNCQLRVLGMFIQKIKSSILPNNSSFFT